MESQAETYELSPEFICEQYQRRYFHTHINSMIELCYPSIASANQRLSDGDIPPLINCINRFNRAVAYMQ
jgi:hypothetical protein